jgi:Glycosyltransferase family 87
MTAPSQTSPRDLSWCRSIGWTLLIVLILAAAGELAFRGFRRALSDMQDFAVIYSSTRAFETGRNPYDGPAMRAAWLEATHNQPGDRTPDDLALYPPTTYLLLSPLALLDWTGVRWAWIFINLAAVAVLVVALTFYGPIKFSPWKMACAAAFILGFGPIHTAIAKGQLTVVVAAILALAVVAQARNAAVLAAIFIGLAASLKPQIAVPIVVLYLLQRQWKAIAVVAGISSGLLCMAWLRLAWAGVPWIGSLLRNVGLASQPGGVYDPAPTNPLAFQLVNASALLRRLIGNQAAVTAILAAIGISVCFFLWKRGQNRFDLLADPAAFGTACVLGLVLISHRYYDASVLVFVFVWALSATSWTPRLVSIAACLVMAFPVPALLISSGHARAPFGISQMLWDAVVIQQQSWLLLILLAALTAALAESRALTAPSGRGSVTL